MARPGPSCVPDLPIAYHKLSENLDLSATGSEYRALMETFDDRVVIVSTLDAVFASSGFPSGQASTSDEVTTVNYDRADGTAVVIRLMAKPEGAMLQAPGASGLLHLT